jgi:hypothetical protein
MIKRDKTLRIISLLFISIGIILGIAIAGGIIWGDLEASLFDSSIRTKTSIRLNCPVAITSNEVGTVTTTLKNPIDREKTFNVRTHISEGFVTLKREINQQVQVMPEGKEKISWEIYPKDAAYGRIVLFRVFVNASYPVPTQGNSCGVLFFDIPWFTGTQFLILILGITIGCIILGKVLWRKLPPLNDDKGQGINNATNILILIVFASIILGFFGFWIIGLLLFVASILMLGAIIGRYIPSIQF